MGPDLVLSPAGKRLTSWLSFVIFNCVFVTFPCGILGQVWYLIVSIPDLFHLSYFARYFFCGSFMFFFLSCVCNVFVRACLYVLCGHLLGKG